jgi:hypothetical protein
MQDIQEWRHKRNLWIRRKIFGGYGILDEEIRRENVAAVYPLPEAVHGSTEPITVQATSSHQSN